MIDDDSIINFGPWSSSFAATMTTSSLFNMIYEAIMNRPSYVILAESPVDQKVKVINSLIEFYEVREDYERCANLVKIKNELEIHA